MSIRPSEVLGRARDLLNPQTVTLWPLKGCSVIISSQCTHMTDSAAPLNTKGLVLVVIDFYQYIPIALVEDPLDIGRAGHARLTKERVLRARASQLRVQKVPVLPSSHSVVVIITTLIIIGRIQNRVNDTA